MASAEYQRNRRKTRLSLRPIIGWDGEGITDTDGDHRYVMLGNSRGESINALPGETLTTKECLDFLVDHAGDKKNLHVIYGGSYDVAMILKTLSGEKELGLYPYGKTTGKQIVDAIYHATGHGLVRFALHGRWYEIAYRARKEFLVNRFRPGGFWLRSGENRKKNVDSIRLWDVVGFSQAPFVKALKKYGIQAPIEMIESMKARRGTFGEQDREAMREYFFAECTALSTLYKTQLCAFRDADLLPTRHDGPGALAAALYKRHGIKEHIALEPEELRVPVASAYFGGRIELGAVGYGREIFSYDIASAYPGAMVDLPSLHGEWRKDLSGDAFGVYLVRYEYPKGLPWYPLPYRDPRGTIRFADCGLSWVWAPEVRAAFEFQARFGGSMEILDGYRFFPASNTRPFAMMPVLYEQRRIWKQEGNGAENGLKLAINSAYGKLAQQLGGTPEKLPPYLSLVWAGAITSTTRAKLVDAALGAPNDIIAFATDGIYSRSPLSIETAKGVLGKWEPAEVYDTGVFVQAGVYWLYKGGEWVAKYRGFDKEGMETPGAILEGWDSGAETIEVYCSRFLGHKAALASRELWKQRCRWIRSPRVLRITGASEKRIGRDRISGLHNLEVRRNEWYELTGDPSKPYDAITLDTSAEAIEARALSEDLGDIRLS